MARAFGEEGIASSFEQVPLSHQTVSRRVEELDKYVFTSLTEMFEKCCHFSMCLDESCDNTDVSQLLIFIRMVQDDFTVHEEQLNLASLHSTTKGVDILYEFQKCIDELGGFRKGSCIVTDGAESMVGTEIG